MKYKKLKFIDLFAGIGGFHEATKHSDLKLKFQLTGFCELDNQAASLYKEVHNIENSMYIQDVKQISTKVEKGNNKVEIPDFDVLFGGFPCQSFSNAGRRLGLNDERGKLFYDILDILDTYSPPFFILENVQKLSTINGGDLLKEMIEALENSGVAGYHVHTFDLKASKYGLPQQRRRLFFCGICKDKVNSKLNIENPTEIPSEEWQYPTTWHLLEKNAEQVHFIPTKTRETVLKKNPKWAGNLDIDNLIARPLTASMSKWHRANQDNYFSNTFINSDNPFDIPQFNMELEPIRRITPLEGFRLQGFPDIFAEKAKNIKLSYSTQYRLIGNAVPVNLAKSVIDHFFNAYYEYI